MSITLTRVMIVLLLFAAAHAYAASSTQTQLLELEQTWLQAAQKRDIPVLQRILGGDYLDINYQGKLRNRADALLAPNLHMRHVTQTLSEEKVRVYSDTAVVTGRGTLSAGGHERATWRFTDVFVKQAGEWRAVSSQETAEADH
ncbi:MAG: nuclear transport factor 2 family protein [Gammaproteobacteria bacterium]